MFEDPPRYALGFSLRTDVKMPLAKMRLVVEQALGCRLEPGDWNRMPFLLAEILGMRIRCGETRGTAGQPTYQLHGITEVPVREVAGHDGPDVVMIDQVVIDLLQRAGGGSWHAPTPDEIRAEAALSTEADG